MNARQAEFMNFSYNAMRIPLSNRIPLFMLDCI